MSLDPPAKPASMITRCPRIAGGPDNRLPTSRTTHGHGNPLYTAHGHGNPLYTAHGHGNPLHTAHGHGNPLYTAHGHSNPLHTAHGHGNPLYTAHGHGNPLYTIPRYVLCSIVLIGLVCGGLFPAKIDRDREDKKQQPALQQAAKSNEGKKFQRGASNFQEESHDIAFLLQLAEGCSMQSSRRHLSTGESVFSQN